MTERIIKTKIKDKFNKRNTQSIFMNFEILIYKDELETYVVECLTLAGCISQGQTKQEAIENIKDAIHGYCESLKKHNEPIPARKEL